jgi:hypothetical protein
VISDTIAKWQNTGAADVQITGYPKAVNWFGAPEESCTCSLTSVLENSLLKVKAILVAKCLSKGTVIYMPIVVHE